MDYYAIGQRIRKFRKAQNLSQEQLAERIGISTTHMSHIETGNTKLSLPVLVDIAGVLGVQTDELIYDVVNQKTVAISELSGVLDSCTTEELSVMIDILKATKVSMDKHLNL